MTQKIDLPSGGWVEVREADDFLAEHLFAIHQAVRITAGAGGETTYSPKEMEDDSVNAFLGAAITAWSFPGPVPSAQNVAAPDKVIGRAMKAKDWGTLRRKVKPIMDELEGFEQEDPKPPVVPSAV